MIFLHILFCFAPLFLAVNAAETANDENIFHVKGTSVKGLYANGVIIYSNHAKSVSDILPDETRKYIAALQNTHLIAEYDIYAPSSLASPYHTPAEFIENGYFDPSCSFDWSDNAEIYEAFKSLFSGTYQGKPLCSMLHPGRFVSKYYEYFKMGFYNTQCDTIEQAGVDHWLMNQYQQNTAYSHFLEDELDRDMAHKQDLEEENFLGWRDEKINAASKEFWEKIFKLTHLTQQVLGLFDSLCRICNFHL